MIILSAFTDNISNYAQIAGLTKLKYALKFGHELHILRNHVDSLAEGRPPAWTKIKALLMMMKRAEDPPSCDKLYYDKVRWDQLGWFFWTDADALIINFEYDFLQKIVDEHPDADIIFSKDRNGINTGNFFIKKSFMTKKFLKEVWNNISFVHHPWWEQAAITDVLSEKEIKLPHEIKLNVEYIDQSLINSYIDTKAIINASSKEVLRLKENIIHLAGEKNEVREKVISKILNNYLIPTALYEELGVKYFFIDYLDKINNLKRIFGNFCNIFLLQAIIMLGIKNFIELGVYKGELFNFLSSALKSLQIPFNNYFLIDTWKHYTDGSYKDISNVNQEQQEANYSGVKSLVEKGNFDFNVKIFREDANSAIDAVKDFQLDPRCTLVFHDANHSYEFVSSSLKIWDSFIQSGHDYLNGVLKEGTFGVKQAVDEFTDANFTSCAVNKQQWPSYLIYKVPLSLIKI